MAATYMLRKHLRSQALAKRPDATAEREIRMEACRRGSEDRAAAFPTITADNFDEANDYQTARIDFWKRELSRN